MENFVKKVLDNGGNIVPLLIDSSLTNGTGLFNPSIFIDDSGDIFVNIRHCQYSLYHSELNKYEHPYGPLVYLNPEYDQTLTTTNYFGQLNDDLSIRYIHPVDTSEFDKQPLWEFVGLEDARITKWDNKFYLSGVRRDLDNIGTGRMELSQIEFDQNGVREISRFRIPAPDQEDSQSYCEKNWMPILDKPYHYLKWCNPCQVVKCNQLEKTCNTVILKEDMPFKWDQRGGSQVVPWKDGYLALTHQTRLWKSEAGRKNGLYRHRFLYWDRDFNLIKASMPFDFMDAMIEFACGLAIHNNEVFITFGFQDNSSYVLKTNNSVIEEVLNAR